MAETDPIDRADQDTLTQHGSSDDAKPEQAGNEGGVGQPPKKRRRVVKPNPDKKFECKHEGCGKSYSRAEHLYRHQLNRECASLPWLEPSNPVQRYPEDHLPMRLP
jgi:hypothetical protein